eukprot:scaffold143741_cov21-Prasinocladus_malaysianus.AAC.1
MQRRVASYYIPPPYITSQHVTRTTPHYTTPCHVTSHHINHIALHRITSHHIAIAVEITLHRNTPHHIRSQQQAGSMFLKGHGLCKSGAMLGVCKATDASNYLLGLRTGQAACPGSLSHTASWLPS